VNGEDVLVIDDNQLTREVLKKLLESEGFSVTCCEDGRSAIDLAKEVKFKTFLIDYRMPGMNGDEVTVQLRRSYPDAFIIGFSMEQKDRAFLTAGANTFLSKDDIDEQLCSLLKAGRPGLSLAR
jgi:CheY-like chemotaxis protein